MRNRGFILSASRSHLLETLNQGETHDPICILRRGLQLLCGNTSGAARVEGGQGRGGWRDPGTLDHGGLSWKEGPAGLLVSQLLSVWCHGIDVTLRSPHGSPFLSLSPFYLSPFFSSQTLCTYYVLVHLLCIVHLLCTWHMNKVDLVHFGFSIYFGGRANRTCWQLGLG